MRALEFQRMLACVLAGPSLAWLLGRFAGRRDWRIVPLVLVESCLAALLLAGVFFEPPLPGLQTGPPRNVFTGTMEFAGFLLALTLFIGMLGWSATPVRPQKDLAD